mmetsp:Transcript_19875/g.55385  ORF Transcript_19875/g.55385 Transcript_19875/m.55385 type:complete len:126 (-) Transcript_19875:33-410(-)|eukprot:CAMPEP_0172373196 /NCGR_PEP_ID=MMETSP1060-20121228/50611_1 /TAXON_ID=37318 /ORGANISM="Pseudo-nitzschia pungens, Strain cf. cingulata" /LENGTH=125 /DNA_ID=CAMNT_0013099445 /DNA_START=147 /DNA_END=524 /DNA_ORIENTATION=+
MPDLPLSEADPSNTQDQDIPLVILEAEAALKAALAELTTSDHEPGTSVPALDTMSLTNFTIGNLSFAVDVDKPKENAIAQVGRLYTKEHRPTVGSQEEKDLIAAIIGNQYEKYQLVPVSLKDVES